MKRISLRDVLREAFARLDPRTERLKYRISKKHRLPRMKWLVGNELNRLRGFTTHNTDRPKEER